MAYPDSTARVTVRVSRSFTASAERVFDAWLDPEIAGKWLFAAPGGKIVRVEIDARVGGQFSVVDRRDGQDIEHVGHYLEIDHPRRLAFEFKVPKYTQEMTRVTIEILPQGTGCELQLTHDGVYADYETQTRSGWTMLLNNLANTIAA